MKLTRRFLFNLSLNLALALNVLFDHSILSLFLLFTMFIMAAAMIAHIAYMALNDAQVPKKSLIEFEEVTALSVLEIIKEFEAVRLFMYDSSLQLVSWVQPERSFVAFVLLHIVVAAVWLLDIGLC